MGDLNNNMNESAGRERQAVNAARRAKNAAKSAKKAAAEGASKKAATGAGSKAATIKGGAAAGPVGLAIGAAVAVAQSETGKKLIVGFLIIFILVPAILLMSLPNLLWNVIFHVDDEIDPIQDKKIEQELNADSIKQKEQEYADIISSHLTDSHEAVYDKIKAKAKADGVDYEATQANIVDSTDFLGAEQTKNMDAQYQTEHAFYDALKKKGYSQTASLIAMAAASYYTGSKSDYNIDAIGSEGLRGDATTKVGIIKLDKDGYERWLKKKFDPKDGSELKTKATDVSNQAAYFDVMAKDKLSKAEYKALKKESDTNKAAKSIVKIINADDGGAKQIVKISETMKQKHLIGRSDGSSEVSDKSAEATTAKTSDNRAADKLSAIRSKSGYPSKEIEAQKKAALAKYKKNKSKLDEIYKTMLSSGLSPAAAAGMLGNYWQESRWNTSAISSDGHGSKGIGQWTGGREAALRTFIKGKGGDFNDISLQAKFGIYEIKEGAEHKSFGNSRKLNAYAKGFFSVPLIKSYKEYAACDDPLTATVNYAALIERPSVQKANLASRYAGAEVILEQCGGISASSSGGSGDPSNIGAGSRQMALILAAFSVKEDQLYPVPKIEADKEEPKTWFGKAYKTVKFFTWDRLKFKYQEWRRHTQPKKDLEEALSSHNGELYDVVYGDIVENDEGKKVYASVEIKPASSDKIMSSVFGMNPDDIYKTEDGVLLAGKDTRVGDVVTTTADNHMEMLYGNHDYGSGEGSADGSGLMGTVGSGKLGNPLGNASWTIIATRTSDGRWGKRPGHMRGFHDGLDMVTVGVKTPPVYAAEDGKVVYAASGSGYQKHVIILHPNGYSTLYGHMSAITVSKGQTVKKGQQVGNVGNGDGKYGYHLHFRVHKGDNGNGADNPAVSVDPETLIEKGKGFRK